MTAINTTDLTKRYGETLAVDDITESRVKSAHGFLKTKSQVEQRDGRY